MNWQNIYIRVLRETGLESEARVAADVPKRVVKAAYETDPDFAATVDDAKEGWADTLVKEAYRRAVHGVDKGVYYKGELVVTEKQYSDTLLSQMLKAYKKEDFAPELTLKGSGKGGALEVIVRDFNEIGEDLA